MYRTFVLLTNSDSEGHRFDFCRAYRRKSPRKCKASGDFCAFFPKALLSTTYFPVPMEKTTHTAYFSPCLHILFRQDFAAVEGDERMGVIVLGILCAAAVVVTLACLWINR